MSTPSHKGVGSANFVNPTQLDGFEDFVERFGEQERALSPVSSSTASQLSSNKPSRAASPVKENRASARSVSDESIVKPSKKKSRLPLSDMDDAEADEVFGGPGTDRRISLRAASKKAGSTKLPKTRSAEDVKPSFPANLLSTNLPDFHRACQFGHISTLESTFRKGEVSDVNAVDSLKNTGLHEATINGHWDVVHLLLKHGASLDARNLANKTPADVARSPSMVAFLNEFRMRSIMAKDHKLIGLIWRHQAASILSILNDEQDLTVRLNLVNEADDLGFAPLHAAAIFDRADVIRLLLKHGAEINAESASGTTPLHDACRFGSPEAIKVLIESGADTAKRNKFGHKALSMCSKPHRRLFRRIAREAGVDDGQVSDPDTWVHFEEPSDASDSEGEGSSESDGTGDGETSFRALLYTGGISREERKLQQMLAIMNRMSPAKKAPAKERRPLKRPSSRKDSSDDEDGTEEVEVLPKPATKRAPVAPKPEKLDAFTIDKNFGTSMLHKHAGKGGLREVKQLVKSNKRLVNLVDNAGYTALHEAALNGHLPVVKFLLEQGADIDHAALNGDTPLHDSAENGHVDVVAFLLQAGANRISRNAEGKTAFDVAQIPRIRAMLETQGRPTGDRKATPAAEKKAAKPPPKAKAVAKPVTLMPALAGPDNLGPLLLVRVGEPTGWFFLSPQMESLYVHGKPKSTSTVFRNKNKALYSMALTATQRQHLVASPIMKRLSELRDYLLDQEHQAYLLEKDSVYAAFSALNLSFGNLNVIYLDLQRILRSSLAVEALLGTSNLGPVLEASAGIVPPKLKMKMQRKGSTSGPLETPLPVPEGSGPQLADDERQENS